MKLWKNIQCKVQWQRLFLCAVATGIPVVAGSAFLPSARVSLTQKHAVARYQIGPPSVLQSSIVVAAAATIAANLETSMIVPPTLTVVIPAYNEESRIEPTLRSYAAYLEESRWRHSNVTILVSDDGSTDGTVQKVRQVADSIGRTRRGTGSGSQSRCRIECFSLPYNQGKGAAMAAAMKRVNSTLVLTTDADGSASVESIEGLYDAFMMLQVNLSSESNQKFAASSSSDRLGTTPYPALACGYRTYADTAAGRRLFRWGFRATVVSVYGHLGVRDSQCGCKLMSTAAAQTLYSQLHLTGWSHDVEVLYRAKLLGLPVTEAPVQWTDIDDSKLTAEGVIKVATRMFYDVIKCRLSYGLGLWTIE